MESLTRAFAVYNANYGTYPATFDVLSGTCDLTGAVPDKNLSCLLDPALVTAMKAGTYNGYDWVFTPINSGTSYTIAAQPSAGNSATERLWTNGFGIHYNMSAPASNSDPLIGN